MPSYEQRGKNKQWSVRFRETDLDTGDEKNVRLTSHPDGTPFKTKREAQAAYHEYLNARALEEERRRKQADSPTDMMMKDLIEHYFRYMATRAKESSVYDARGKFEARIIPYFEPYLVSEVTPILLLNFMQSLTGYSFSYQKKIFAYVCAVLNYGEKYHNLPNVSRKVDKPRNMEPKKEMLFWTPEEFAKFYRALEDTRFRAFFHLLYESGCRKGEAEALLWSDFNFQTRTVSISKNITRKTSQGAYAVTTPKNASSNRVVTLTEELCRELADWNREQKKSGVVPYAFGSNDPPSTQSIARAFSAGIEAAGVRKIRIHDLRHSCASLLISRGVSIVAVSKRLGHSTVEQTLNTYAHMLPDDNRLSLSAFQDLASSLL